MREESVKGYRVMARIKEIATAVGTLACAVGIGFVMQNSDSERQRYGAAAAAVEPLQQGSVLSVDAITLTSGDLGAAINVPAAEAEVITVSAPQSVLSVPTAPTVPQAAILPACDITASARPVAAAMVSLTMEASCLPVERVTVHHNGMIFTETTSEKGTIALKVPALSQDAVFVFAFSNGEGAVAQTTVEELEGFDRVVVQWKGETGFQIHAREFGADYGADGHVWADAPRDMAAAVADRVGFVTRHGNADLPDALMAEVYSFPTGDAARGGTVALSVETEISTTKCGLEIEAQSLETTGGGLIRTQDLTLAMPDCDAVGDFLVLNNLLTDLKVAAN